MNVQYDTSFFQSSNTTWPWRTTRQFNTATLLLIFLIHAAVLYAVFSLNASKSTSAKLSSIILQWIPLPAKKKIEKPLTLPDQSQLTSQREKLRGRSIKTPEQTSNQANLETTQTPQPLTTKDPTLDPFAVTIPPPQAKTEETRVTERYRNDAGKAWKAVEAEQPIKRWLYAKKELTTMEQFAKNLMEAAPAREIRTSEEMLPDGSRMTKVQTPRGEFCVVAAQPGRTYEARGPEKRVVSCPAYF